MNDLIIGGIVGAISRTLTAPLELYKIQKQNKFIQHSFSSVLQKEGIRYLWKGNLTNVLRIAPQMSLNYSIYKSCQQQFTEKTSFSTDFFLSGS